MCGFAGLVDWERRTEGAVLRARAQRMAGVLAHRGPDDEGVWADAETGVALGHRRLSIIDLSSRGHQPMVSPSGRYVIAYNGEIYNFRELRAELEGGGAKFCSDSDTEVVLAACEAWGAAESLARFNGMFAFALWDRQERRLMLARDRFGEKPLYYAWRGSMLLFASELKGLRTAAASPEIDRNSLALFFRYNCIPAPYTIFKNVFKLPPASFVTTSGEEFEPKCYWPLPEIAAESSRRPWNGSAEEAVAELRSALGRAVRLRMIADVPLGAFLSGGVDSSTLVALMQQHSSRPVKTFSIGLSESEYNEAEQAKAVAAHLKTEHTELYVSSRQALDVVPRLAEIYDEPFSDSSQIPTHLLCKLARTAVSVSLSGDGGDEIFGGYNRYAWLPRIWRDLGWLPHGARSVGASILRAMPPAAASAIAGAFTPNENRLPRMPAEKLRKIADAVGAPDAWQSYVLLASHWSEPGGLVMGATEPHSFSSDARDLFDGDLVSRMMAVDSVTFLPDDVLTKVDRASMAVSLEVRAPFLDPEVFQFAWRLPLNFKIRDGTGKWIVRQLLSSYVPKELVERSKMGFGIPLDSWLRSPLRDWAESLLEPGRLRQEGYLNAELVDEKWQEHISGRKNWQYHLWDVLMFESWLEHMRAPAEQACVAEGAVR